MVISEQNLHFTYVLASPQLTILHLDQVLNLNPDADKQKIRRRFRKLVVPWRPKRASLWQTDPRKNHRRRKNMDDSSPAG